jgi:hypothetical protein
MFASLLGRPAPNAAANPVPATIGAYSLGTDPFCNDLSNQPGVAPWPGSNATNVTPLDDQDYDPIRRPCAGRGTNISLNNPTEQVCERATRDIPGTPTGGCTMPNNCPVGVSGTQEQCQGGECWDVPTLGLLLPIISATRLTGDDTGTVQNTQYDLVGSGPGPGCVTGTTGFCVNRCNGGLQAVNWLKVRKTAGIGNTTGLCPNGDPSTNFAGICLVPADSNGNPNCMSFKADLPPQLVSCATQGANTGSGGYTACSGVGPNPGAIDPRAYNLYSYTPAITNDAGVVESWSVDVDDSGRPVTGAYWRIHTSQAMLAPNSTGLSCSTPNPLCTFSDPQDQIGCLVQASPCSAGYVGRAISILGPFVSSPTSLTCAANNTCLKLDGVACDGTCP